MMTEKLFATQETTSAGDLHAAHLCIPEQPKKCKRFWNYGAGHFLPLEKPINEGV